MFDMINIFEVFLPQLLRYPNPTDPLNGEAAALLMRDAKAYDVKVKGKSQSISHPCTVGSDTALEYVSKYANKDAADEAGEDEDEEDEMSSAGSFSDDEDEEPAGQMEV